ncbi:MazG-like family protein [Actinomadura oligospora]|uniref:MazG-like family protein n=1 Tax=Actinomadura oligospora TaxID=111804 RepID=UPI00047B2343|nr:MazG-like family protein [Actinomadura oligospora]
MPHTTSSRPDPDQMARLAEDITDRLREHFPREGEGVRQALALAEEAGEFLAAYRRWSGRARRTGTLNDVAAELADVLITTYVTACVLDMPLGRVPEFLPDDNPDLPVIGLFRLAGSFLDSYVNNDGKGAEVYLTSIAIAAQDAATTIGIDLRAAVDAKVQILYTRGWRDPR